ncbi:MAG: hypothetical protein ABIH52_03470 [Candidatus Aenigmatarchaeota archaeon]
MPKRKTQRKAVRDPVTGRISHYTSTKTVGLRSPITGRIEKRISKKKAKKRGLAARIMTISD